MRNGGSQVVGQVLDLGEERLEFREVGAVADGEEDESGKVGASKIREGVVPCRLAE